MGTGLLGVSYKHARDREKLGNGASVQKAKVIGQKLGDVVGKRAGLELALWTKDQGLTANNYPSIPTN